ncbi:MAG: TonB-dependent receptor [Cyclobacteriaceae bacterium]|nr:TonB-dependent receptor [Cyclobacteriaceae bacterium]
MTAISTTLAAQVRMVKGKVTTLEGGKSVEMPGVNVVIVGTSKGTTTDIDGSYSLELADSDKELSFSFIGYTMKTVAIGGQTVIDVVLETDTQQLEEVVVVGYGVQKKSDITGSTANVKGDELYKQPVLTATQALQGKVAGVQIISSGQPGSSPQIRVRGVGTTLGGTTALYVVDGVLTDDISNINTADIVDMNILKDASAAAIYGSRGANGVIIITTKRGKEGKLVINYNNSVGFRQASNLVEMANSREYSNYVQAATGSAPPASSYNTNWYDVILRTALQQNHNISLSSGTDKSTYLFNVGYLTDEGIVIDNDFKRFTMRLNNEYKINNIAKFGFQGSYANSVNQNGFNNLNIDAFGSVGSVYNDAYRAAPFIPSIVNGKYGNTSSYQNVGNPLLDIKNNSVKVKEDRIQGSTFIELKPLSWLTVKSSFGVDVRNATNRVYNYQFESDESTFIIAGGNQRNPQSALTVQNSQAARWVWDNTFTINKKINNHEITFLGGTTAESFESSFISASRKDVPADPNLWYIGVGDANTSQNNGGGDAWTRNSYLARLNYSYNGKYLLTATVRRDGSSRLPSANRWQNYPSVGLAWVASREPFMQNQKVFDLLKIRASYGKVGNDQIDSDSYTNVFTINLPYAFNGYNSSATNGARKDQFKDTEIVWEITEEFDFAIEFGILDSKLTGEINYYDKKVNNALIFKGIRHTILDIDHNVVANAGVIQNKGLEVALNWKDKINENLSYTINANATFNSNNVLDLNGGSPIAGGGVGSQGPVTNTNVGQPVGSFYVLKTIGVFNSDADVANYVAQNGKIIQPTAQAGDFKYQDLNGDGIIDNKDRQYVGSYQPVAYFGLNLGANYKRWDFNISIYGNVGNKVYNGKKGVRILGTDNIEKSVVYSRWTSANRSQKEPAANTGNLPASDYFVESGSFVRINNLTIGYSLPPALLTRARLSSFRVFLTSQNLFTFQDYTGFTAELPGSVINSGIELTAYPTTRTIAMGVNIGF